jgi:hypothetical protein
MPPLTSLNLPSLNTFPLCPRSGPINPPAVKPVSDPTSNLERGLFSRPQPYAQRRPLQPTFQPFPTTTIGSFPQTAEVRRLRAQLRSGALTQQQYETLIDQQVRWGDWLTRGLTVLKGQQAQMGEGLLWCFWLADMCNQFLPCPHCRSVAH